MPNPEAFGAVVRTGGATVLAVTLANSGHYLIASGLAALTLVSQLGPVFSRAIECWERVTIARERIVADLAIAARRSHAGRPRQTARDDRSP